MKRINAILSAIRSSPTWPVKFALLYTLFFALLLANSCRVDEEISPDALATAAVAIPTWDAAYDALIAAEDTAEAITLVESLSLLATVVAITPVAQNRATATAIARVSSIAAPIAYAAATQEAAFYRIPESVLRATATGSAMDAQAFAWRRDPRGKPPPIQTAIVAHGEAFSASLTSSGTIPPSTRTPLIATIVAFSTVDAALATAYVTEGKKNEQHEQVALLLALLWESPIGILLLVAVAFLAYGVKKVARRVEAMVSTFGMSNTTKERNDDDKE